MADAYEQRSAVQKKYYDETAGKYDAWHVDVPSARIVNDFNFAALRRYLGDKKPLRCLELGCGTGRLVPALSEFCGELHGIDISEEMVRRAREKYPSFQARTGEVTRLPYPDGHFDLVIVNGALHHFFALDTVLAEAHRVLAPGSVLAALGEPNGNYLKPWNPAFIYWFIDRVFTKLASLFWKNAASSEMEPEAETFTRRQFSDALAALGFRDVALHSYDYLPRHENRVFLRLYPYLLRFERAVTEKALPGMGSALQFFARK